MLTELADTVLRSSSYVVSGGILLNVIDDTFIDARYFLGRLARRERRIVSEEALRTVEQKRVAIMLPAWKEADVIEQMLEHNVSALDFDRDRFDVFCGTYQNDPETQARVDAASRRFKNVHKVVVPHDGPTSKADCLNWVYQGLILEEKKRGRRFDILLMQDAEDLIHPLALRLYSLLIPPNEFVQTPVFSVPLPMRRIVSATYIDEFAEHHLKDMLVRESIGGLVPSAGVGSAFDRTAFEEIATAHGQHPFNVDSLTEDYEIGLKFRLANRKTHFACRAVERRDASGGLVQEYIATRELFPGGFSASIRQRSRWILGITLQTWAQIGWQGAFAVLYCLWRDRKALVTNTLLLSAYALMAYVMVRTALGYLASDGWTFASVAAPGSALAWMLSLNLLFALWRVGMKALFVGRLYGAGHALLSLPRLMLANVIGVLATGRAVSQYVGHRWSGKPLRWLKTAHEFPSFERLAVQWRRLGDLLLERSKVTTAELEEALALQRGTGARLGDLLALTGVASERDVTEAIGQQLGLATVEPTPRAARELLRRLPEVLAEELDVLPIEEVEGAIVVAMAEPLDGAAIDRLELTLGSPIVTKLAPQAALRAARERAYRRLLCERSVIIGASAVAVSAPHDIADRRAVSRLGVAFCAFHRVMPLRTLASPGKTRVLTVGPVHRSVHHEIQRRLGVGVDYDFTTPLSFRIVLALVEGLIPTAVGHLGLAGVDAVEWLALRRELAGPGGAPDAFIREAQASGMSVLDHLEATKAVPAPVVARARARTFGLPVSARGATPNGVLPTRLARAHDITVVARDAESVHLATPRPTPRLAQQVAALLSPLQVAWSVSPSAE